MTADRLDLREKTMPELMEMDAAVGNQLNGYKPGWHGSFYTHQSLLADRRQIRDRMQELRSGAYHMGGNNG